MNDGPDRLREAFRASGCLLIDGTGHAPPDARRFFLDLEKIFGMILRDEATDEGWYPVCRKGAASDPRYLADADGLFALHTDQAFSPSPPDLMGLLCETAAPNGGESLVADGAALYRFLRQRVGPDGVAPLFEAFYRLRRPPHVLRRPLFSRTPSGRIAIAYRGSDAAAEASYPESHAETMGLVKAFLSDSTHVLSVKLRAGQVLLLDNRRYLHGRTPFSGDRLLFRLHFRAAPTVAAHLGIAGSPTD